MENRLSLDGGEIRFKKGTSGNPVRRLEAPETVHGRLWEAAEAHAVSQKGALAKQEVQDPFSGHLFAKLKSTARQLGIEADEALPIT